MTEKTMKGKKCPKCLSFVKDDSNGCSVCGFEWAKKRSNARGEKGLELPATQPDRESPLPACLACPKCGTENSGDFKYCKICKHPLKAAIGDIPGKIDPDTSLQIRLDWKVKPSSDISDIRLDLTGLKPYFTGYAHWKDYAFFVFPLGDGYQILVKKSNAKGSGSVLFRKCSGPFMMESGREFYLGAVRFQVLGDLSQDGSDKTLLKSDKTVLRGPGEKQPPRFLAGKSRIKILDLKPEHKYTEITGVTPIGRTFLVDIFGLEDDELRQNGISKEHIRMTPFARGKWLLEPQPDKPVFEEINEIPLFLNSGDILRWVGENRMGEFKIHIVQHEV